MRLNARLPSPLGPTRQGPGPRQVGRRLPMPVHGKRLLHLPTLTDTDSYNKGVLPPPLKPGATQGWGEEGGQGISPRLAGARAGDPGRPEARAPVAALEHGATGVGWESVLKHRGGRACLGVPVGAGGARGK